MSSSASKNVSRYARYFKNRSLTLQQREHEHKNMIRKAPDFFKMQMQHNVDETLRLKDNEWKFMPGDRVQILEGAEKGRVGKVSSLMKESNGVTVEGLGGTVSFFQII